MEDKRFKHIKTDPKFRRLSTKEKKVKIDKRFESMFNDKKFKVKYTVDKRGRPVKHSSSEDLQRYYELSSESSGSESEIGDNQEVGKYVKIPENELKIKHKSDKLITDDIKKKLKDLSVDYARGEAKLLSESSSDDDDESDEIVSEAEDIEHNWGELDAEAEQTEQATSRLAACNMDWDRIRAVDLMVLFNSFLPPGGFIKSVVIYPSEFGKERMKEEELKGPAELVTNNNNQDLDNNNDDNEDKEEGDNFHMEKLRQYQLNRLKYYYAIISFDSINSANKIYTECDGMEYESSAVKLDLRFVPEDMDFNNEEAKEVCDKLPEINKYQPRFFTNTALQQAKVDLTWDETDPNRTEVTHKLSSGKLDELSQEDLKNYLASSSGEDTEKSEESEQENDDKDVIGKYKSLLQDLENKEESKKNKNVEMEITWGIDLKDKTDKLMKEKSNEDKTPFEKYLDKRKEKRKERKKLKKEQQDDSDIPSDIDINDPYFAEELNNSEYKISNNKNKKQFVDNDDEKNERNQKELELLLMNNEDNKNHFSLKKIQDNESSNKNKRKSKKKVNEKSDDNFNIDINDERFSALFTSHHYNIDPTDPNYKKTKNMEVLIKEKLKRRAMDDQNDDRNVKKVKKDPELSSLVKSVKRKTIEYLNK